MISRRVGEILLSKMSNADSDDCIVHAILEKGENVKVLMSGKIIAEGAVSSIGFKTQKRNGVMLL